MIDEYESRVSKRKMERKQQEMDRGPGLIWWLGPAIVTACKYQYQNWCEYINWDHTINTKSNLSSPTFIICSRWNRLAGLFTRFALWCGFFLCGFCLCSNLGLCASNSLCRGCISGGNVVICCSMVVWFCLVHFLVLTLSSTGHDENLSSVSQFNPYLYANSTPIMPVNSMEARCLPPACFICSKTLWLWKKSFVMMSVIISGFEILNPVQLDEKWCQNEVVLC